VRKVVTSRAGGFRLSVHKGFPSWTAAGYHYPTEITRILCGCRRIHSRTSVHCLARLLDCSASRCCQLGICPVMPLWPLFTRILNLSLHAAAATAIAEGSGRRPPLYDLRLAVVRARRPRAALAASAEGRQHGQAENQAPHCGILRCSRADERDGFRSSVSLFWTWTPAIRRLLHHNPPRSGRLAGSAAHWPSSGKEPGKAHHIRPRIAGVVHLLRPGAIGDRPFRLRQAHQHAGHLCHKYRNGGQEGSQGSGQFLGRIKPGMAGRRAATPTRRMPASMLFGITVMSACQAMFRRPNLTPRIFV
jgi:hypothetical protein